jgi:hypothetical protein
LGDPARHSPAAASALAAQEFTESQREELGGIIRDYLLENPEILREVIEALEVKEQEAGAAAAMAARSASVVRSSIAATTISWPAIPTAASPWPSSSTTTAATASAP